MLVLVMYVCLLLGEKVMFLLSVSVFRSKLGILLKLIIGKCEVICDYCNGIRIEVVVVNLVV